ncbi:MAG: hypothetical protein RI826_10055, partial [Chlorobium phaeovibrioides]|nr:hypothetical protein [Chlorobium phaeovibrioides]
WETKIGRYKSGGGCFFFGWQVPGGMIRPARVRGQYARSAPPLFGFSPASSVGIARDEKLLLLRACVALSAGWPSEAKAFREWGVL